MSEVQKNHQPTTFQLMVWLVQFFAIHDDDEDDDDDDDDDVEEDDQVEGVMLRRKTDRRPGTHFVRACEVQVHIDIAREQFDMEI